jgi:hypothetical protein
MRMFFPRFHIQSLEISGALRAVKSGRRILLGTACAVWLLATVAAAQSVTILQPVNNGTSTSPVAIQATVQDSSPVSYTQIYVDGIKQYEVLGAGVSTSLPMTAGIHRVTVQAGDTKGTIFKSTVYTTVGSGSPPPPAPTPTGMTVFSRIEEMSSWLTCGACGNSGGTGAVASYQMTRGIGSPSMDGSSAEFSISGPAYKNGYWYISQYPAPAGGLQYLAYDFYLYMPSGMQNAPQAIEFECQQGLNGWTYNFAWQAEYPSNTWRVFNYVVGQWEATSIALQRFSPGTWHHILAEFHTDAVKHLVYHDALTVDGVRHAVNLVHAAKQVSSSNYLNNAFQLDLNFSGTPYHVYVDEMKVSYK